MASESVPVPELSSESLDAPFGRADYLAGFAFFLSGVLALVYEICWIRSASLNIGATTHAVSTVIAVFFGGLAIGNWLFGRLAKRTNRPLRVYALLEISIGVLALASPFLLQFMYSSFGSMYPSLVDSQFKLLAIRALMVAAVILPPTILIGGTLPLFVRHYVRDDEGIARPIGWLYTINTIGAAIGCLLCGLLLMRTLGVNATIFSAAGLNILLGSVVYLLPMKAPELGEEEEEEDDDEEEQSPSSQEESDAELSGDKDAPSADEEKPATGEHGESQEEDDEEGDNEGDNEEEEEEEEEEEYDDEDDWGFEIDQRSVVAWMFFFTGFAALGYEILWTRFLGLVTQNTIYTYTFSLTIMLAGMAIGTWISSRRLDRSQNREFKFALIQAGIGISVLLIMLLPTRLWGFVSNPQTVSGQLLLVAVLLTLPSILIGMSFPVAIRMVVDRMRSASSDVGRLVAFNTLGGIAGSLVVGFLLLYFVNMQNTLKALTAINVLISIATLMLLDEKTSQAKRGLLVLAQTLFWIGIPYLSGYFFGTELPKSYLVPGRQLTEDEVIMEGHSANIAVLFNSPTSMRLEIDGMWQGANERNHQLLAAHVPAILHPNPSSVLVVGLGAGQTAKAFLSHPQVTSLEVVEIEKKLIGLVQGQYFGDSAWMRGTANQSVKIVNEDGRNYVSHIDKKYDIISIEVGQVFRPSIANFYTLEFYKSTRERITEGGMVCQFVPLNFLRPEDFQKVVATFREVFPTSLLWYNTSELLMIGTNAEQFQLSQAKLQTISRNEKVKNDLQQSYWGGPADYISKPEVFLGGFITGPAGMSNLSTNVLLLTDDVPALEYLKQPDPEDFQQTIYGMLTNNKQNVANILAFPLTAQLASKTAFVQEANLRHIVAEKYLARAKSLQAMANRKNQESRQAAQEGQRQLAQRKSDEAQQILPEVIAHLQQGKKRLTRYAPLYESLGRAYAGQQNYPEAFEMFSIGISIDPKRASLFQIFGVVSMQTGDIDSTIHMFREAVKLKPIDINTTSQLAQLIATRPNKQEDDAQRVPCPGRKGHSNERGRTSVPWGSRHLSNGPGVWWPVQGSRQSSGERYQDCHRNLQRQIGRPGALSSPVGDV